MSKFHSCERCGCPGVERGFRLCGACCQSPAAMQRHEDMERERAAFEAEHGLPKIAIRSNNCTCREWCAVCGIGDKWQEIPYGLFLEGTYASVCYEYHRPMIGCAEKYAPDLLKEIRRLNKEAWKSQ